MGKPLPQAGPIQTPLWGNISRLASGQAVLRWRIPPAGMGLGDDSRSLAWSTDENPAS